MTPDELKTEWQYVYDERVAILCADSPITPQSHKMALDEADEHIRKINEQAARISILR